MASTDSVPTGTRGESVHREYILDVRVVEVGGEETRYRFEAPDHDGRVFENPERAELYADVYFVVNGFVEEGTGERGVPPEIIAGGRDTLAAYFLTMPWTDLHWVGSFFGHKPSRIERYAQQIRDRAAEIRRGAVDRGVA